MALSPRTVRIAVALLISLSFIAAGYYFSSPMHTSIANADSTDAALKAYAQKDTDSDGLPDWQEALYGTDPANAHSVNATMTDSQAVKAGKVAPRFSSATSTSPAPITDADFTVPAPAPGSLTDEFAKSFFQTVVQSGQSGSDNQDALVASLTSDLSARIAEKTASAYSLSSVRVGQVTATQYAGAVEQAMLAHDLPEAATDPASLSNAYISNNDASAKANLALFAKANAGMAADLAKVTAPAGLAATHLALIQSTEKLGKAAELVVNYQADPLATLGALALYEPAAKGLTSALATIAAAVLAEGQPAPGAPGALIVGVYGTRTP